GSQPTCYPLIESVQHPTGLCPFEVLSPATQGVIESSDHYGKAHSRCAPCESAYFISEALKHFGADVGVEVSFDCDQPISQEVHSLMNAHQSGLLRIKPQPKLREHLFGAL